MRRSVQLIAFLALTAMLAAGLAACGGAGGAASPAASASPSASGGVPFPGAGAAKRAPGLYDLKDDSVVVLVNGQERILRLRPGS